MQQDQFGQETNIWNGFQGTESARERAFQSQVLDRQQGFQSAQASIQAGLKCNKDSNVNAERSVWSRKKHA